MQTQIINAINNSPLNRGLDGRAWLSTLGNIAITNGDDVTLFDDEGDGIYQAHVLYTSRGKEAIASLKDAFRQMFEDHGADLIMGLIPDFRRDAKMLVRWAGGKSQGLRNTSEGPCELFVLSKAMWRQH